MYFLSYDCPICDEANMVVFEKLKDVPATCGWCTTMFKLQFDDDKNLFSYVSLGNIVDEREETDDYL